MEEAGHCEGQRLAGRETLWPEKLHMKQGGRRTEVPVTSLQFQIVQGLAERQKNILMMGKYRENRI